MRTSYSPPGWCLDAPSPTLTSTGIILGHSRTGTCIVCSHFKAQYCDASITWPPYTIQSAPVIPPLDFQLYKNNIFKFEQYNNSKMPAPASFDVFGRSIESSCNHNFCSTCLTEYFQYHKSKTVSCPICYQIISYNQCKPSPSYITTPLKHLKISCSECGTNKESSINHKCPPKQITVLCSCNDCEETAAANQASPSSSIRQAASLFAAKNGSETQTWISCATRYREDG